MRSLRRFGGLGVSTALVCALFPSDRKAFSTSATLASPFRPRSHPARDARSPGEDADLPFGYDPQSEENSYSGLRNKASSSAGSSSMGGKGGFAGGPGSSLAPKAHLQETPTKDRMPPAHYNPADPRRRLAVLIDGSRVDAATYAGSIEPAIYKFGVPVLVRVFDTELRDGWLELVEPSIAALSGGVSNAALKSDSPYPNLENKRTLDRPSRAAEEEEAMRLEEKAKELKATPSSISGRSHHRGVPMSTAVLPSIEWFRMDRFIPVNVQIAADAQHIFDFRTGNKIEGVVFVCTESERASRFEKYFPRLQGNGFSQLSFDERGAATTLIEDGREGDGSV